MNRCLACCTEISKKNKYCDNVCQASFTHDQYISEWKAGRKTGDRGVNTKNLSAHLVRYLKSKYNDSCSICNWHEVNLKTGQVPLEIDHMNGNSSDNAENNLRVLCPNCHSLTSNYKNSNKGNGREWRKSRYNKVVV